MSIDRPLPDARVNRRQALKIGGITASFAAIVAACGTTTGSQTPGRVGYAPAVTDPPDYAVDDAVRLRTASSLEETIVSVYGRLLDSGSLSGPSKLLTERLIDNHQEVADQMAALTEAEGGVPWECTNPWLDNRLIEPVFAAIKASDNPERDVLYFSVALENLAAATHQVNSVELSAPEAKVTSLEAATQASRQSAAIVALARGPEGYISPEVVGEGVPTDPDGVPYQYAITSRFGSVGQFELVVGPPDKNGVYESFTLQTPAENSFVYNELEPSC
jgi:hypothetical protein